jgi:glycosyltransferase involved in cell wall biosynthesis
MTSWKAESLSVVVPVFDEEANAQPLVEGIANAVRPLGIPFEIVIVDDGSRDRTREVLRSLTATTPELVVVNLRRNFGQTLALQAGLDRARGRAIVTMDGDLQNDPTDIGRLLERLEGGADVVSGWRRQRQDTLVLRKVPSWIANRLVQVVTGIAIHDQGCSLKAYRREVIEALDLYGDMHRFIAVMTLPLGAVLEEVEVRHHPRVAGRSKYGISRVFRVIVDLFALQMLTRFRESPLLWFGLLGAPFLVGALITALFAAASEERHLVLPTTAMLMAMTFTSSVMFGLLSELIIETSGHARKRRVVTHEWRD